MLIRNLLTTDRSRPDRFNEHGIEKACWYCYFPRRKLTPGHPTPKNGLHHRSIRDSFTDSAPGSVPDAIPDSIPDVTPDSILGPVPLVPDSVPYSIPGPNQTPPLFPHARDPSSNPSRSLPAVSFLIPEFEAVCNDTPPDIIATANGGRSMGPKG